MAVIQTVWSIRDANTNKTYKIINADYNQYPLARGKANSFCATLGLEYNRGFVLMRYADVAEIISTYDTGNYNLAGMRLELTIQSRNMPAGSGAITHKSLKIKSVVSATTGPLVSDSVMLVELVDASYVFLNFDSNGSGRYYPSTLSEERYNWNNPFGTNSTSASTSLDSYNTIFRQLWRALPCDTRGDYEPGSGAGDPFPNTPDLPVTPSGYPHNVIYAGGNVYEWLHYFISPLWCVACKDTTLDYWVEYDTQPDWNIVKLGETQTGLANSESTYSASGLIKYDSGDVHNISISVAHYLLTSNRATQSNGMGVARGSVAINDNAPLYGGPPEYLIKTKYTTAPTAMSGGDHGYVYGACQHLYDSAPFNYGKEQADATSPAVRDSIPPGWSVTINTWQHELAGYYSEANAIRPRHIVYAGVIGDILPGSEVKATLWRDYGDGTATEVIKYPGWPKSIWRDDGCIADNPAFVAPRRNDFDCRRQLLAEIGFAHDRQMGPGIALVQVGSQMSTGSTMFHGAFVGLPDGSTGGCLIKSGANGRKLTGSGDYVLAIFNSQFTYGGTQYPLFYAADANGQTKQTIVSSVALSGIIPAGLTLTTSTVSRTVMNDAKTD